MSDDNHEDEWQIPEEPPPFVMPGYGVLTPSPTAPTYGRENTFWFDTSHQQLFVRHNERWIPTQTGAGPSVTISPTPPVIDPSAPLELSEGRLWFDSSHLIMFVRFSGAWVQFGPRTVGG